MLRTNEVRAVLFDLDGTLISSHDALWGAYATFMTAHDCSADREEFASLDGPSIPEIVRRLRERHTLTMPAETLETEYRGLVHTRYIGAGPTPGADETLATLSQSHRLALVTSAPRALVDETLRAQGWTGRFEAVVTGEDGHAKPNPDLYRIALGRLELAASDGLAVEDSPSGIRAAAAAGIQTVAVASSDERAEALRDAGADAIVSSLHELTGAFA